MLRISLAALAILGVSACRSTPAGAQPDMTPNAAAVAASADDPTTTDPDKYVAILDNADTRVLRYHDEPGGKTHAHQHPDSVLYALSAFERRLTFPDGTTKERSFVAGDVMWIPAQTHVGENIGTTPTEVLIVEFKRDSHAAP